MKYLMDELWYSEHSYADALCPMRSEIQQSQMGENQDLRLPTFADFRNFGQEIRMSVKQEIADLRHDLSKLSVASTSSASTSNAAPTVALPQRELERPAAAPSILHPVHCPPNAAGLVQDTEVGQLPIDPQLAGLVIPRALGPLELRWEIWTKDWIKADPPRHLHTALKDWKESWYSGTKQASLNYGTNYNKRRVVADEYYKM